MSKLTLLFRLRNSSVIGARVHRVHRVRELINGGGVTHVRCCTGERPVRETATFHRHRPVVELSPAEQGRAWLRGDGQLAGAKIPAWQGS